MLSIKKAGAQCFPSCSEAPYVCCMATNATPYFFRDFTDITLCSDTCMRISKLLVCGSISLGFMPGSALSKYLTQGAMRNMEIKTISITSLIWHYKILGPRLTKLSDLVSTATEIQLTRILDNVLPMSF